MDIRYFLDQRLTFIKQFYTNSATLFIERIRKINEEEEPFIPPYSEDGEPAFLCEWIEAQESLQVLGHHCISMLSATFHLYFKAWEHQLGVPCNRNGSYKSAFKQGWLNGYHTFFLRQFNIQFEDSPCDLGLLEELTLARNRVQHPESITNQGSHYSEDDLKKLPSPFFIDDREYELFSAKEEGERSWLMPPTIRVTPEKLFAAISEVACFAEWFENHDIRALQK